MRNRPIQVMVHLNEREYRHLVTQVKRTGLNRESYLRCLIEGRIPKETPPLEYHKLINELNAIGHNLNQIAVRAHVTGNILADAYKQNYETLVDTVLEIMEIITVPEPAMDEYHRKRVKAKTELKPKED